MGTRLPTSGVDEVSSEGCWGDGCRRGRGGREVGRARGEGKVSAAPARKKMRFDTESTREEPGGGEKPQTLTEAVAKANRKRRLYFLATPEKEVAREGDKRERV